MPAVETFRDIPEIFETVLEESIKVRNDTLNTFKQLGPADLVHVVKTIPNNRQQIKEVSSYHFALGVDTSSSASIAAYINSLTYSMKQPNKWFGGLTLKNSWSLNRSTYCTFNAFSGVDVRVEARIPGGVKSYTIDSIGVKRPTTSDCWQEVYLSSILRTIFQDAAGYMDWDSQDGSSKTSHLTKRNLNGLLLNLQLEMKFLELSTKLFSKGWQLGVASESTTSSLAGLHNNFLTVGLMKYFCGTGRPEIVIGFLKPFAEMNPNLSGIIFKCYLEADQQGLAIKTISNIYNTNVKINSCVTGQVADFLIERNQMEKAKHFAEEAVRLESSEFCNWFRLVSVEIDLGNFERALIILNNAPISFESATWNSADSEFMKKLPKPAAISIPSTNDGSMSNVGDASIEDDNDSDFDVDGSGGGSGGVLEKLKGNGLRGNYREAYELIVKIYKKIGWEALLAIRSKLFVMEEEYRENNDGFGGRKLTDMDLKAEAEPDLESDGKANNTIHTTVPNTKRNEKNISSSSGSGSSSSRSNNNNYNFLHKTDKKLCEKWLDNLFLILFQDLRIFSLFSQEREIISNHNNNSNAVKKRSRKEWFLLGKLSERLKQNEDAKFAYQKCLFSSIGTGKSGNNWQSRRIIQSTLSHLIQIYCEEGRLPLALTMTLRLINSCNNNKDSNDGLEDNTAPVEDTTISHNNNNNMDFNYLYSSKITYSLFNLIKRFGLHRIRGDLEVGGLGHGPTGHVFQKLLHFAQEAKVHGFDY